MLNHQYREEKCLFFFYRTESWFFTRTPAPLLVGAFVVATTTSTIFACALKVEDLHPIKFGLAIIVWVYCIIWFLIQDAAKVYLVKYLNRNLMNESSFSHEDSSQIGFSTER